MIRTITESEALTLAVRGDVPGVLDGLPPAFVLAWLGPAPGSFENKIRRIKDLRGATGMGLKEAKEAIEAEQGAATAGLPLANPLVQAHLVGWLGRGERCPCGGAKFNREITRSERAALPALDGFGTSDCSRCNGTGYLRPRHNRYAWLTPEAHGGLPDWIRMALIWGSVVRVAAGMGALERLRYSDHPKRTVRVADGQVTLNGYPFGSVEEAEAEVARCNAEALAKGGALIDTTPAGRVIRFEVPE